MTLPIQGVSMHAMSTLPASEEELRLAIQDAVRSVAEDLRRRSRPSSAPGPSASPSPEPDPPDPLEGQTILMVDEEEAEAAQADASGTGIEEDRRGVEEALGIAAPAVEPPQAPAPSAPAPALAAALTPPPEAPLVEVPEPSLSGRLLIFSWTALIRVLSILDLAVPAPVRRHKVLLGRIGMALTSLSAAFLAGMVLARLLKG